MYANPNCLIIFYFAKQELVAALVYRFYLKIPISCINIMLNHREEQIFLGKSASGNVGAFLELNLFWCIAMTVNQILENHQGTLRKEHHGSTTPSKYQSLTGAMELAQCEIYIALLIIFLIDKPDVTVVRRKSLKTWRMFKFGEFIDMRNKDTYLLPKYGRVCWVNISVV